VELVKEATGASEEEITITLQECNYDVNAATNKLIDGAPSGMNISLFQHV